MRAYRLDGTRVVTSFEDVVAQLAMEDTRHVAIASRFAVQSTRDEGNGLKSIFDDHGPAPVSHVERAIDALVDALPRCGKDFSFVTAERWADASPLVQASERKPDLVLVLNDINDSRRIGWP
ncbi:hypothetical protein LJR230_001900 [Trinickia sp. LjRoot230]|uniref:hypothetical protein n=1 Tax=Trinickia sp. LjRoot230 TaxID=3342288 RepID=UPI003ECF7AA1